MVGLTDNLVHGFDIVELLTVLADRCVEVLDVSAAGVMLGYPGGDLRLMASSSEAMRILELFELQSDEGPCPDCYRSGEAIVNRLLAGGDHRWPRFGPKTVEAGFKSVHALPMRVGNEAIGALNLFRADEGALSDADVATAQALADIATIAILLHADAPDVHLADEKLRHALDSRTAIEQAARLLAEDTESDRDRAFAWLRDHARRRNLPLVDIARSVIDGSLTARSVETIPPTVVQVPPAQTQTVPSGIAPTLAQLRAEMLTMLEEIALDALER